MPGEISDSSITIASGVVNAYYTNLLRLQMLGKDTSDKQVQAVCLAEVKQLYAKTIKDLQAPD